MKNETPIIMTIDSGKMNTKGFIKSPEGEELTLVFRTIVVETIKSMHADFKVIFKNTSYSVGDASYGTRVDEHFKGDKNITLHHISTLKMVANLIQAAGLPHQGLNIELGINVPIKQFLKPDEREKFVKMYEGEFEIIVGDETFKFNIVNVVPFFEGSGILFKNLKKYAKQRIMIVDNGGLNSTYVSVDELKPQNGANSLETGTHNLFRDFEAKYQHHGLSSEQFFDILEDNKKTLATPEIKADIAECVKNHVYRIYQSLDGVSKATVTNYVFVGGATGIYRQELEKYFPHAEFTEDTIYDNVKGFYTFLAAKNKRKSA